MPFRYNSVEEAFDFIAGELASIRGEAMAARALASIALDWLVSLSPDKAASINNIGEQIDQMLNSLKFVAGDADMNEKMREIARLRCDDTMANIKRRHTQ